MLKPANAEAVFCGWLCLLKTAMVRQSIEMMPFYFESYRVNVCTYTAGTDAKEALQRNKNPFFPGTKVGWIRFPVPGPIECTEPRFDWYDAWTQQVFLRTFWCLCLEHWPPQTCPYISYNLPNPYDKNKISKMSSWKDSVPQLSSIMATLDGSRGKITSLPKRKLGILACGIISVLLLLHAAFEYGLPLREIDTGPLIK